MDVGAATPPAKNLESTASQHRDYKNNPELCPLCQEDDSIEQKIRDKRYKNPTHLQDHMKSKLHLPRQKWIRIIKAEWEASGNDRISCPYCVGAGKPRDFDNTNSLIAHIEDTKLSGEHDRLKREDGWYGRGWDKQLEERSRPFRQGSTRRGIRFSDEQPLLAPRPHERSGLVRGAGSQPLVAAPGTKIVTLDEALATPLEIPPHLQDYVRDLTIDEPFDIPQRYKHLLKTVSYPEDLGPE